MDGGFDGRRNELNGGRYAAQLRGILMESRGTLAKRAAADQRGAKEKAAKRRQTKAETEATLTRMRRTQYAQIFSADK